MSSNWTYKKKPDHMRALSCSGLCSKFTINRARGKSFYELNVRCTPCEHYIPRKEIVYNNAQASNEFGQNNWDARFSIRYSNIKSLKIDNNKDDKNASDFKTDLFD